jgi:hypothetical protein
MTQNLVVDCMTVTEAAKFFDPWPQLLAAERCASFNRKVGDARVLSIGW